MRGLVPLGGTVPQREISLREADFHVVIAEVVALVDRHAISSDLQDRGTISGPRRNVIDAEVHSIRVLMPAPR